ncbi:Dihydroorotase [hydrothermal vent metagenome]|uniref:Dihydroorotase n=1 Tax=hydrothermal vent metagenome TaxID=652676 RepID=A0A3B1B7W6_9ZZZZ
MQDIIIVNARVVNDGYIVEEDVRIHNGRIEQVASDISIKSTDVVVDAAGKVLMPGMIDDQVHFREPGATHKGDIYTESRAAVAGGITSFMDMPNTNPLTVTLDALEQKYQLASQKALANYAFYLGATNDNIEAIRALDPKQACGIKVFMGASTGNMLVDKEESLDAIFRDAPVLVATHCEDTPTILANEEAFRKQFGDDVPMECHPEIRSEEACFLSSSFAVKLAKKHGTRLHVLHLSTAREMKLFQKGALDYKRITAEACVHHLYFDVADYELKGAFIKCNPAIKTQADRDALRRALLDGRIDVIGTDHAPHTLDEKLNPYFSAPAGLPLVQHALPMVLELYHKKLLSLELIAEKTSHGPARLFNVQDRGYIREGYWADLVLVDLDCRYHVEREQVMYKCGWSPMEGRMLNSAIHSTFVNGHHVYHQGEFDEATLGQRLVFKR